MTDLLKKGATWKWGELESQKFEEMKCKLANYTKLGPPLPQGEIVVITDSSDVQGGASIFQWQPVPNLVLQNIGKEVGYETKGLKIDGTLEHSYPPPITLYP